MGKEKSVVSSKNNSEPRKSSLLHTGKKPVKKKPTNKSASNYKKETANEFCVDSLEYLRDMTKKKELNVIDEKIKLLKTELKTLLHDKVLDKNYDCSADTINDSKNSDLPLLHNSIQLKSVKESEFKEFKDFDHLQMKKKNFQPLSSSTPSKFLEQLKETIDKEISVDMLKQKVCDEKNFLLNSKSQIDLAEKSVKLSAELKLNIFNVSSLSWQKIEKLIYESFVMKNSELNLSFSEESDSESRKYTRRTKEKKFLRSKKQSESCKGKFPQHNVYKCYRSTQKGKKRRLNSTNFSQSDVEIINLDNSSCSEVKTMNDTVQIDSYIKDCDWNEPFDLNNTEFHTELEILESCEKKEAAVNQGLKLSNTDLMKTELSGLHNENENTQFKRVWECPVCFEPSKGQEVVATQCGHIFCKKCLENHFSVLSESCPSCRANLKKKPFITLFNF